jgi:hypothetical protein
VSKSVRKNKFTMNRRQLVANTFSLVPGVALSRGHDLESESSADTVDYPSGDCAALRASQNTEEVVMGLLHLYLQRIGWQGEIVNWRAKINQALDHIQSRLTSGTEPLILRMTGYQMGCLRALSQAVSAGDAAEMFSRALLLCDACLPFEHWIEKESLPKELHILEKLAHRYPEFHAVLVSTAMRIIQQELGHRKHAESLFSFSPNYETYQNERLEQMITNLVSQMPKTYNIQC